MKSRWKFISEARAFTDPVLSVRHRTFEFTPTGMSAPFTVIDTRDWVVTPAIDTDGRFVMVRQFRFATEDVTLEFPGGAINAGEDPSNAAVRELGEETGVAPRSVTYIGTMHPNPAILSNRCHVYLCEGCEPAMEQNLDLFEDVEVVRLDEDELFSMIKNGEITHGVVIAALSFYLLHRR